MRSTPSLFAAVALAVGLTASSWAQAQTVSYSGNLERFGAPIDGGFVIAGTFAPSFDPLNYNFVYGVDGFGNMDTPRYAQAVSDGNFIPIGLGTLSSAGAFAGSGMNTTGLGRQVWLFGFPQANPDMGGEAVLATNPAWTTSASDLTITASDATFFKFGGISGAALQVSGLPTPEPTSIILAASGIVATVHVSRRRLAFKRFVGGQR